VIHADVEKKKAPGNQTPTTSLGTVNCSCLIDAASAIPAKLADSAIPVADYSQLYYSVPCNIQSAVFGHLVLHRRLASFELQPAWLAIDPKS